jgi:hypothetical protein
MTDTPERIAKWSWPEVGPKGFMVKLEGGRTLWVPWVVSFALTQASVRELAWLDVSADRRTIRWPLIRHELRVAHLAELAVAHERAPMADGPRFLNLDLFTEAM